MAGLISNLLLLTVQYVSLDCTKRTFRWVYQPYGPEMCRLLCQNLEDTLYFVKEDLSCHRFSTKHSVGSIKNSLDNCPGEDMLGNHATVFNFKPELNVCNTYYEDVYQSNELQLTKTSPARGPHSGHANRNIPLHQACAEGNLCAVQFILSQIPADINSQEGLGRTPIMVAAMNNQVSVFDFLINQSCDITAVDNNNDTVLHIACEIGNIDIVRKLVNNRCDIQSKGHKGMTPVLKSALHGHRDVLDLLVSKGCNVTILDDNMNNILHVACIGGHVDMVEYVLRKFNRDIECSGEYGRTPIMIAAHRGHIRLFDFFLSKGSDLLAVDNHKDNILHIACIGGHLDMVQHILNNTQIDIESKGKCDRTPVMRAAIYRQNSVIDFLVNNGCNLTAVDEDMNTVLHQVCVLGHFDMVRLILSKGKLSIDSRGQYGRTPVMYAVKHRHRVIVEYLVGKGCNLTLLTGKGDSVLHYACYSGSQEMVKYVLSQHNFAIDCRGQFGRTPVMVAADLGHMPVFMFLVKTDCNLTVLDSWKNTILHAACHGGNVEIVKHILKKRICGINSRGYLKRTPMMVAAYYGEMSVFVHLMNQGCNVMSFDQQTNNVLHLACVGGNVDIVKYIVENNIVGMENKGQQGWTPVMTAAYFGHITVFVHLVDQGSNLTIADKHKNSILHLACMGGNVNIVKYILEKNIVDVESRGEHGQTPLMSAAFHGHMSVFVYLVNEGCKLKVTDRRRNNVLHLACCRGHLDIVKYIVENHIIGTESRGRLGFTPVMMAAYFGRLSVVQYLVGKNCKLTLVDKRGRTVLDMARKRRHKDIVKYLITIRT